MSQQSAVFDKQAQRLRKITLVERHLAGASLDELGLSHAGRRQSVTEMVADLQEGLLEDQGEDGTEGDSELRELRKTWNAKERLEYEKARIAFDLIDADRSGTLTRQEIIKAIHAREELRDVLHLKGDLTATEYDEFFSRMDFDMSEAVDFDEFKDFVSLLSEEERLAVAEQKRKQMEEEERALRDAGALALSRAQAGHSRALSRLSQVVRRLSGVLGSEEVERMLRRERANPAAFAASDRPAERDIAEALLDVEESERMLRVAGGGGKDAAGAESLVPNPAYAQLLVVHNANVAAWASWRAVDDAFLLMAGGNASRSTLSCDEVVERLVRDDNVRELLNLHGEGPATTIAPQQPELSSSLLSLLDDAADSLPEETPAVAGNSGLLAFLDAAADQVEEEDGFTTAATVAQHHQQQRQDEESDTSMAVKCMLSFNTIEISKLHLQLAFCPAIGNALSAFSLIAANNRFQTPLPSETVLVSVVKSRLLTNFEGVLDLLHIAPGTEWFDFVYSRLLGLDPQSSLSVEFFVSLFEPTYSDYLVFSALERCLPPSLTHAASSSAIPSTLPGFSPPSTSTTKSTVTSFYSSNPSAARIAVDFIRSVGPKFQQYDLQELLDLLPERDEVTRDLMIELLVPHRKQALVPPPEFLSSDVDLPEPSLSFQSLEEAQSSSTFSSSITPTHPPADYSANLSAAFALINKKNAASVPKKDVVAALRDNTLLQRLVGLSTHGLARDPTWVRLMGALGNYATIDEATFLHLLERHDDAPLTGVVGEEKKEDLIVDPRADAKEAPLHNIDRIAVPVLDVKLAERYVAVRKAFDLLDINEDNGLSLAELGDKFSKNKAVRELLSIPMADINDVSRKLHIHASNEPLTWEKFRKFFIKVGGDDYGTADGEDGSSGRFFLSEQVKEYYDYESEVMRSGMLSVAHTFRHMVATAGATVLQVQHDYVEPDGALQYNDPKVVSNLDWRKEQLKQLSDGPPPIPKRGTEMNLDSVAIDGPQWYVVLSPREQLGMQGPIGVKDLIEYWEEEAIDSHTLVWKDGFDNWIPIDLVSDLKAQLLLPELTQAIRPSTAPSALSGFQARSKMLKDPVPTKLATLGLDKPCSYCGMLATMHVEDKLQSRQIQQGVRDRLSADDPDKTEIMNSFLFIGNASSSREKIVEMMEYTHIINVSAKLPCYWDFEDDCNSILRESVTVDQHGELVVGAKNRDGKEDSKKAVDKYKKMRSLNIKYFRVALEEDPTGNGRPDTSASRGTIADSEADSRPQTAMSDPLFSRPTTAASRPVTSGGSRPATSGGGSGPQNIEILPEIDDSFATNEAEWGLGSHQRWLEEQAEMRLQSQNAEAVNNILQSFEAVYEWLSRENINRKVRCLIHCKTGTISSVAIGMAFIIRDQALTYEECLAQFKIKHGIEKVQVAGTLWEQALFAYSEKYSIGRLLCDDCFLDNFAAGKSDERVFSEEVAKAVERLKRNDATLVDLDLRDEGLGSGKETIEEAAPKEERGSRSPTPNPLPVTVAPNVGISTFFMNLRDNSRLVSLDLSGNCLLDSDCVDLGSSLLTNEGLKKLSLSYNRITCVGCIEIARSLKVHAMTDLDLSFNNIKTNGAKELGKMLFKNKSLLSLNIGNNNIEDDGGFALFDSLTSPLYESEAVIAAKTKLFESGESTATFVAFNAHLTSLDVSCCGLGQVAAKRLTDVLQMNMVLKSLYLDYNPKLGNAEVRNLANVMRTFSPKLTCFSFGDNQVGNDVVGAFARYLASDGCTLRHLDLSQNCLRSTGVNRVAAALGGNSVLVSLDLARNPIGSKGLGHLAEALKLNSTLETLIVACCGIDGAGATTMGKVLKTNNTLTELDISDNMILNDGIVDLIQGLSWNGLSGKGVKKIDLTNTGIGGKGADALAKCFEANGVLENVNLSSNQIRNLGCKRIADALEKNLSLKVLNLSFNGISSVGITAIMQALKTTSSPIKLRKNSDVAQGAPLKKVQDLDVILVGNDIKDGDEALEDGVSNSQLLVPRKLARSKVTLEYKSKDKLDVSFWQGTGEAKETKESGRKYVRRASFDKLAGSDFDKVASDAREFSLSSTLIKSKSVSAGVFVGSGGLVQADVAEALDVTRARERAALGRTEGTSMAWNSGFKVPPPLTPPAEKKKKTKKDPYLVNDKEE